MRANHSDILGAAASGLCTIHCIVTPFLFVATPLMEETAQGHVHGSNIWEALNYIFLVLSFIAVWHSTRHSDLPIIKWVLWISWLTLALGLLTDQMGLPSGRWLMYIGSISLIVAHLYNFFYLRKGRDVINS